MEKVRLGAEAGSLVDQTILGICYLDGIDLEPDYEKAYRLLSGPARRGVPRAMYHLGRMYAVGLGIPVNIEEAIRLLEKAADRGEFFAKIELARIYLRGTGVPSDPEAALKWYSAAAAQAPRIVDCPEKTEALEYVATHKRCLGLDHRP